MENHENKDPKFQNLTRPIQVMPQYVLKALQERNLHERFKARPAYQQNDYLSWIIRAKRPATVQKRLNQMLQELEEGHLYMKMIWKKGN